MGTTKEIEDEKESKDETKESEQNDKEDDETKDIQQKDKEEDESKEIQQKDEEGDVTEEIQQKNEEEDDVTKEIQQKDGEEKKLENEFEDVLSTGDEEEDEAEVNSTTKIVALDGEDAFYEEEKEFGVGEISANIDTEKNVEQRNNSSILDNIGSTIELDPITSYGDDITQFI